MKTKQCIKCKNIINIKNFSRTYKTKLSVRNECKKCRKKYLKEYSIKNKENISLYNKQYHYSNNEKIKARKRKYNQIEYVKEKSRLQCSKRRTLKKTSSDWTITIEATRRILEDQWGVCNYCWLDITDRSTRHLDHIHPVSKWWCHSIYNVQWLCINCNLTKWNKL